MGGTGRTPLSNSTGGGGGSFGFGAGIEYVPTGSGFFGSTVLPTHDLLSSAFGSSAALTPKKPAVAHIPAASASRRVRGAFMAFSFARLLALEFDLEGVLPLQHLDDDAAGFRVAVFRRDGRKLLRRVFRVVF